MGKRWRDCSIAITLLWCNLGDVCLRKVLGKLNCCFAMDLSVVLNLEAWLDNMEGMKIWEAEKWEGECLSSCSHTSILVDTMRLGRMLTLHKACHF